MKNINNPNTAKDLKLLIVLFVALVNYWIWRIIFIDPILATILLLLTVALYKILLNNNSLLWITSLLFIFATVLNLKSGFDINLWIKNAEEINKLNQRHFYYAQELEDFYKNRIGTYIYNNVAPIWYKFKKNVFSSLDFNLYFFASHPRERAGIEEFKKYAFIFTPFFLIGSGFMIVQKTKIVLTYLIFSALISGLITPNYTLGPVLFFPLINLFIAFGIIIVFSKFSKIARFLKISELKDGF